MNININSSSSSTATAHVLYVDHQGHPAPLTECFHATASRRLSSTLEDRFPPSSVAEVDSAYCPQCLSFHDAASAARLGYCPKVATCSRCPRCVVAVVSVTVGHGDDQILDANNDDLLCYFQCGQCDWASKECNLTVPLSVGDGEEVSKLEIAKAAEELGVELKRRRDEEPSSALQDYFGQTLAAWNKCTKPSTSRRIALKPFSLKAGTEDREQWSVEMLEASLEQKRMQHYQQMATASSSEEEQATTTSISTTTAGPVAVQRLSLDEIDASSLELPYMSLQSFQWQVLASPMHHSTNSIAVQQLPLPTPLRVRKSRRCRAELAEGRPGILLKPKLNPLEGDSSLRTGHGQWWKKDSSAIHVVPQVRVVRYERVDVFQQQQQEAFVMFLLQVSNPTLSMVRLRFASSEYTGEYEWEDDPDAAATTTTRNTPTHATTTSLTNLLVDTLTQTRLHVELQTNIANNMEPSDTVELSSAEDSIIELGGKVAEIPEAVVQWTATESVGKNKDAAIKLLASNSSKAWFELVIPLCGVSVKEDDGAVPAIPIQLQVERGNGSWESSLIVPKDDGNEKDWVSFDLVIVWK